MYSLRKNRSLHCIISISVSFELSLWAVFMNKYIRVTSLSGVKKDPILQPIMKMTHVLETDLWMGSADCKGYAGLVRTPEWLF